MKIGETFQTIKARQIITSRLEPTVEVELHTSLGVFRSSCPSGASTESKEAKVIVDKKPDEYFGKGVKNAIFHIKTLILPRICDMKNIKISDQKKIDEFLIHLDGTDRKSRIGANAILPISMAFCRAGAVSLDKSLREFVGELSHSEKKFPIPYFNVINGGVHSGNLLPFQEIMVSFHENEYDKNLEKGVVFYHHLKNVITKKYGKQATGIGDEGGFPPPIDSLEEALQLIMTTYEESKLDNMKIAIDSAASEFYIDGKYDLDFKKEVSERKLTGDELLDYYKKILEKFPLLHIFEDPFAEEDYDSWRKFSEEMANKNIDIIGDDLTVTNVEYIKKAIEMKLCNTLLVKLNQIGTVYETIQAVELARSAGMKIMVSHRSGETEDTFIGDFAVGLGADYIKSGAPCRGERVAKYNQLLRIYEGTKKKK